MPLTAAAVAAPRWPPPEDSPFSLGEFHPPIPVDLKKLKFLSREDPAVFLVYEDDATVHAACGLPGSLVPQQATPEQTAAALRNHVVQLFLQVSPGCRVADGSGAVSESVFQRLSNAEWNALGDHNPTYLQWGLSMNNANLQVGKLYVATPSPGGAAGGGRSPQAQRVRWWALF